MNSVPVDEREAVQGELGLGTLPALIRRLHEDRRTGILHIHGGGAERRVHFQWGAVVFAGSARIEDRLDQLLLEEGLVDAVTLREARQAQESSGKRFGECLIDLEALSEDEVLAAVERQVRSIVTFLFSLDRGHYYFEETEDPVEQDLALDLPMRDIIVEGIRSMVDPIALRIGVGAMTDYLHAGLTSETANVTTAEGFVLSRVDGRTNILDVLSVSPLGEVETLRSICALLAVGNVAAMPDPLELPRPAPEKRLKAPPPAAASPPPQVSEPAPSQVQASESPKEVPEEAKRRASEQRYQEGRRLFSGGKYHEAIGALMEAVRLDGTQASHHRLLGQAYARNPKWRSSAIEHLEQAVRLDEFDEKTYYLLGEVLEQDGRDEEARAAFKNVLMLEPNHQRAQRKLQKPSAVSRLKSMFKKFSR